MSEERLQKLIARAGIASRRAAEQLILDGAVTLNGRVVTELGTKADPEQDHIKVRGKLLLFKQQAVYAVLHKPKGYVTTLNDPQGRPTIVDLIKGIRGRVFPVGRLDFDTEGLLLLTNDGELANGLMHPSREVPKVYAVKIKGKATDEELQQLEAGGIYIGPGRSAPCRVRRIRQADQNEWLEITLHEGKKRQIRVMLQRLKHPVLKLIRTHYAGIALGDLPRGHTRFLSDKEIRRLRLLAGHRAAGQGRAPVKGSRSGLAAFAVLMLVAMFHPRPSVAQTEVFAQGSTVLGQTGAVTVSSADVLSPWRTRAGISTYLATGSGGNRFDLLAGDTLSRDQVFVTRGALALGLPRGVEVAVTLPYVVTETDALSSDGVGDLTVATKIRLRNQSGWNPAAAVTAGWIPETARTASLSSVSTNGYFLTLSTQLGLSRGDWSWVMLAEVGGFWRDPDRVEGDASLHYGIAGIVPLGRTGLYADTGEVQFVGEVSGTSTRRDYVQEEDDVISVAPGLRYVAPGWVVSATGTFTTYEHPDKDRSTGVRVEFSLVF